MSTVAPRQAAAPAPAVVSGPTRVLSIDAFRGFVMFLMLAEAMRLWTVHDAFPESRFWAFVAFFLIFFVVAVPNPITETFVLDEADLLLSSLDQVPLDELLERFASRG